MATGSLAKVVCAKKPTDAAATSTTVITLIAR